MFFGFFIHSLIDMLTCGLESHFVKQALRYLDPNPNNMAASFGLPYFTVTLFDLLASESI